MSYTITPVQLIGDLHVKRDDLFFTDFNINGTKYRQCKELIAQNLENIKSGIITGCSVNSPQAPIVATVAKEFNVPCTVVYGGTNFNSLKPNKNYQICKAVGADVVIPVNTGRQAVLQHYINERVKGTNEFVVRYGIDIIRDEILINSVSKQAVNIPEDVETLCMVCGSGITTIGVLMGLQLYKKYNLKKILLIGTAPNRLKKIYEYFSSRELKNDFLDKIVYNDLYHTQNFSYDKELRNIMLGDIFLHPRYEAKAYNELLKIGYVPHKTLFWIVGSEIIYK